MGRPLYYLAGTLLLLALLSLLLSFTSFAQQPGSAGDATLWRTSAVVLFLLALLTTLGGTMSSLFEQAERRHELQDRAQRAERTRRRGKDEERRDV